MPSSRLRSSVLYAGLLALLLPACGTSGTPGNTSYSGKTILLGAVISLTGPGGIYGPSQKNGLELAREMVNKDGVNGAKVDITIEDDQSDKTVGAQKFQALIEQKQVLGIVGPTLSNTAAAAHPVANQSKTPVIAPSNTGPGIVGTCAYPCTYIFRDSLGEATTVPNDVKYAFNKYKPKKAVLMYASDDKFSYDGAGIFDQALKDNGIQNLGPSNSNGPGGVQFSKSETKLDTLASQAKQLNPEIVAISTLGGIGAKLMIELRNQGYTGPIIGGNGFNTYAVAKEAGQAGKDALIASAYWVGNDAAANKTFVDAYKAKYNEDPDQVAAQAYTAVLLFAEASRNAGLGFGDVASDRDKIRNALEQVNIDTPLGPFSFTQTHDVFQKVWINSLDGKGGFTNVASVQPG